MKVRSMVMDKILTNSLVATDLDGTLLDHETYQFDAALPALDLLKRNKIPLIIVTSKTEGEVTRIRETLGFDYPFIVENGGAIIDPSGTFCDKGTKDILGIDRERILAFLDDQRASGYSFQSFRDLGERGISSETGLSVADAKQANQRIASEPLVWQDSERRKTDFLQAVESHGFRALQGGRFLTLGGDTNKGFALQKLISRMKAEGRSIDRIIALGDSANDAAMLKIADFPVWIRKKSASPMTGFMNRSVCTLRYGPQGWNDILLSIFT